VVEAVARLAESADDVLVVTADRQLRGRVSARAPRAQLAGPSWLLGLVDLIPGRPTPR
jgi:hypothetical protein